jgi:serine/threonine protein kinase
MDSFSLLPDFDITDFSEKDPRFASWARRPIRNSKFEKSSREYYNNTFNSSLCDIKKDLPIATIDDFSIGKPLGSGKYGQVYLARAIKNIDLMVAIKVISKIKISNGIQFNNLKEEVDILLACRHEHVIDVYDIFEDEEKMYLITEYADGGDLFDVVFNSPTRLKIKRIAHLFKELCLAVKNVHDCGYIHRDIKVENIVISRGKLKLIDFGGSINKDGKDLLYSDSFFGTLDYTSPELLYSGKYNEKVDIWSLGNVLYEMFITDSLFVFKSIEDAKSIFNFMKEIDIISGRLNDLPNDARDLISKMLLLDPSERIDIDSILSHPFLN